MGDWDDWGFQLKLQVLQSASTEMGLRRFIYNVILSCLAIVLALHVDKHLAKPRTSATQYKCYASLRVSVILHVKITRRYGPP